MLCIHRTNILDDVATLVENWVYQGGSILL